MGDEQKKSVFENEEELSENMSAENSSPKEEKTMPASELEQDSEVSNQENDEINTEESVGYSWDSQSRQTSVYVSKDKESDETEVLEDSEDNMEHNEEEQEEKTEDQNQENPSDNLQKISEGSEQQDSSLLNAKKQKKDRKLYTSTIIVLVLVIASIAVYGIYTSFFQTSLKGAWVSANVDEVTSDSILLVFDEGNDAYMVLGNVKYLGTYSTSVDEDGNNILVVDIPYALQGELTYEFIDKNTLSIKMEGYEESNTFKCVEIPDSTLEVLEDYVIDESLCGTWLDPQYNIEYTFMDNGRMHINEGGVVEVDCVYTINDGTIHVEYYAGDTFTMDMEYSVDGDNLTIGVMYFVKTANADGTPIETESVTQTENSTADEITEELTEAA